MEFARFALSKVHVKIAPGSFNLASAILKKSVTPEVIKRLFSEYGRHLERSWVANTTHIYIRVIPYIPVILPHYSVTGD